MNNKIILILAVIIFVLCGCSKSSKNDEYLSLSDLLTTERSAENDTDTDISETTAAADKPDSADAATAVSSELPDETASTGESTSDSEHNNDETIPLKTEAFSEASVQEKAASEPETIVVYKYVEVEQTTEPVTHFYSNTYNTASNSLVFSPHEIYYVNGQLHATMYIYNGHETSASSINNVILTLSNGNTLANASFGSLDGCSIAPYSCVLWDFTFPPEGTFDTNADLNVISTSYRCNYTY